MPAYVDRPVSNALVSPRETQLGQLVAARAAKARTRNDSGFTLVGNAELAFTSRMALIRAAQKTLDIQYYAICADDTTERMFDALPGGPPPAWPLRYYYFDSYSSPYLLRNRPKRITSQ